MRKEEIEALIGNGFLAHPIEDHIQAVMHEEVMPFVHIAACTVRFDEAAPALRAVLAKGAAGAIEGEAQATLLFRGLYVLAAARDRESFQPFLCLLRRPAEEVDWLLGDAITQGLPRIAAGLFDGDAEALFEAIADQSIEEYARSALLEAATFLSWDGKIAPSRMREFLLRFDTDQLAIPGEHVWIAWAGAIALLGLEDLVPLARRAWEGERIWPEELGLDDFDEMLADARQRPADLERLRKENLGYIEDVCDELSCFDHAEDAEDERYSGAYDEMAVGDDWAVPEPVINPLRNVGRNDPCPCGSGLKAKKCCLKS